MSCCQGANVEIGKAKCLQEYIAPTILFLTTHWSCYFCDAITGSHKLLLTVVCYVITMGQNTSLPIPSWTVQQIIRLSVACVAFMLPSHRCHDAGRQIHCIAVIQSINQSTETHPVCLLKYLLEKWTNLNENFRQYSSWYADSSI